MTPKELVAQARAALAFLLARRPHSDRDCDGCGHVSPHAYTDGEWVCLSCKASEIASMADAARFYIPGEYDRDALRDAGRPR